MHPGGWFHPNASAIPTPAGGRLLVDAPGGVVEWARGQGWNIEALLLTHAHLDHIEEAAAVQREWKCPVYFHRDGEFLLRDKDAFRRYGIDVDLDPVTGGEHLDETPSATVGGIGFRVLLVPGHCPGSLCFFRERERMLFAGDTLFAGSIGNAQLLLSGIRGKIFPLGDDVRVLPGHGPTTTIGEERRTNPFVGERV